MAQLWDLIISVLSRTDAEKSMGNLTFNIFFCLSSQFCSSTVGCVTRILVHSLSLSLLPSPFFLLQITPIVNKYYRKTWKHINIFKHHQISSNYRSLRITVKMIHGKFEDPQPESHLLLASRLGQLFYVVKKVHVQTTFVRDKHDLVHQLFDHEKKMFFCFFEIPRQKF